MFESRLRQEVHDCSPGAAQSAAHCSKCTLGWVKCREHISLLIILSIIVYVTNVFVVALCIFLEYVFCLYFYLWGGGGGGGGTVIGLFIAVKNIHMPRIKNTILSICSFVVCLFVACLR